MLLGSLEDDEYWSEYGVMVVIDGPGTAYDSADYAGEDDLDPARRYDAQDSRLAPGGRWLYDFRYDPPTMTVTDVSGPAPRPAVTWPLPRGSATELVSGRRPTWEDATHVLLTIPYGVIPAIRIDATTGATERLRLDRHGQGERGQYEEGAEFGVDGFVEPFQLPSVTRHPS